MQALVFFLAVFAAPLAWVHQASASDAGEPRAPYMQAQFSTHLSEAEQRLTESLRTAWMLRRGAPQ